MYLVFTRMPGESYRRRLGSLLVYLCYVFEALIHSLVCWCYICVYGSEKLMCTLKALIHFDQSQVCMIYNQLLETTMVSPSSDWSCNVFNFHPILQSDENRASLKPTRSVGRRSHHGLRFPIATDLTSYCLYDRKWSKVHHSLNLKEKKKLMPWIPLWYTCEAQGFSHNSSWSWRF